MGCQGGPSSVPDTRPVLSRTESCNPAIRYLQVAHRQRPARRVRCSGAHNWDRPVSSLECDCRFLGEQAQMRRAADRPRRWLRSPPNHLDVSIEPANCSSRPASIPSESARTNLRTPKKNRDLPLWAELDFACHSAESFQRVPRCSANPNCTGGCSESIAVTPAGSRVHIGVTGWRIETRG